MKGMFVSRYVFVYLNKRIDATSLKYLYTYYGIISDLQILYCYLVQIATLKSYKRLAKFTELLSGKYANDVGAEKEI